MLVLGATAAVAHPLGNISVNHHLGVVVSEAGVEVTHLVDLAEIPAVQALRQIDADDDGTAAADELDAWARPECDRRLATVSVTASGESLALTGASGSAEIRPGQAGLDTLRITCTAAADVPVAAGSELRVGHSDDRGRVGWNEVVVSGRRRRHRQRRPLGEPEPGPHRVPGRRGQRYPCRLDLGGLDGGAAGAAAAGGGGLPAAASAAPAPVRALGDLVTAAEAPWAVATAIGAAFLLGVGHALAPGHGKTLMAALLVGRSGTMRNAAGLGLSVAVSHTLGVAVLGDVDVGGVVDVRAGGGVPVALGGGRGHRARARRLGAGPGHRACLAAPDRPRGRGRSTITGTGTATPHPSPRITTTVIRIATTVTTIPTTTTITPGHAHPGRATGWWRHRHLDIDPAGGWKAFAALGLSGGLVPSASAVVLLLGAVHLGRLGLGVVLVAAFGLGMAAALTGVGALVVVFGGRVLDLLTARATPRLTAAVPVLAGSRGPRGWRHDDVERHRRSGVTAAPVVSRPPSVRSVNRLTVSMWNVWGNRSTGAVHPGRIPSR